MTIQINTDNNIDGKESLNTYLKGLLTDSLSRFSNHITRIELHLTDQNGHKEGTNDQRCMLEARLEGMQPIAVSNQADTLDQAVKGSIEKLKSALDTTIGKLRNH